MEKVKKLLKARELTSLVFLIALFVIVGAMNPMFLDPSNVSACFNSSVVYTLVAVGMAFVLFIGEIDVSVGANLGLTAAVVGTMLRDGQSLVLAIIVAATSWPLVTTPRAPRSLACPRSRPRCSRTSSARSWPPSAA